MIFRRIALLTAPLIAAGGLAGGVATAAQAAACTTSAQYGTCSYPPYVVNQDEWNETTGSTQTLTATGAGAWKVTTSQPPGAYVRTYPDVSQNLPGDTFSTYNTAVQSFTDSVSYTSGTGETAADLWLNGAPGTSSYSSATVEVMVWTDNNGQTPAGTDTTTATINGQTFQVWECNTSGCVDSLGHIYFAFVLEGSETSGQIHDVDTIGWLVSHGLMSSSLPFNQIDYGAEFGNMSQTTQATLSFTKYSNGLKQ
jgi:Glycosyl hydrolase family 12